MKATHSQNADAEADVSGLERQLKRVAAQRAEFEPRSGLHESAEPLWCPVEAIFDLGRDEPGMTCTHI